MFTWWTWDLTLGLILGAICAVTGFLGAALVGYQFLRICGVKNDQNRRAVFWSIVGFGLPAAIASFVYGYWLGSTLVYP